MKNKIIQQLREEKNFLSGQDLSSQLQISRSAVWKNIEELRKEGYVIEAIPHRGYKLTSLPDKLLEREIQSNLSTQFIGQTVYAFDEITSTMDEAVTLAMNGAPEGTLVCAELQTRGRGRLGRQWISPKGEGLYFSILLRPTLPVARAPQLTIMSAVALCESIHEVSLVDAKIKWPNDILVKGKKLAGVLTEMNAEMDRIRYVVVGVGLNVNTEKTHLPPEGTSLRIEASKKFDRVSLLQNFLMRFEKKYLQLQNEGTDEIWKRWRELSSTLGRHVQLNGYAGEAVDLDHSGGLLIKTDEGQIVCAYSGDVIER